MEPKPLVNLRLTFECGQAISQFLETEAWMFRRACIVSPPWKHEAVEAETAQPNT